MAARKPKRITDRRPRYGSEGRMVIGFREVPDPFEPDKIIRVPANVAADALQMLLSQSNIDNAQFLAGCHMRDLVDRAGGKMKVATWLRDVIDGTPTREDISQDQVDAAKRLAMAKNHLGWRAYAACRSVAVDGLNGSLVEVYGSGMKRKEFMTLVRHGLTDLAVLWGYEQGAPYGQRGKSH